MSKPGQAPSKTPHSVQTNPVRDALTSNRLHEFSHDGVNSVEQSPAAALGVSNVGEPWPEGIQVHVNYDVKKEPGYVRRTLSLWVHTRKRTLMLVTLGLVLVIAVVDHDGTIVKTILDALRRVLR